MGIGVRHDDGRMGGDELTFTWRRVNIALEHVLPPIVFLRVCRGTHIDIPSASDRRLAIVGAKGSYEL